MHLKMSSGKCQPFCPSLNVLNSMHILWDTSYVRHELIISFNMRWVNHIVKHSLANNLKPNPEILHNTQQPIPSPQQLLYG